MDIPEEYNVLPQVTETNATKRKCNPENWVKSKKKKEKYEARNKGCILSCNHRDKSFCKVRSINIDAVYRFHRLFWEIKDAVKQRMFIQSYIEVSPIKRCVDDEKRRRSVKRYNILCRLPVNNEFIPVCRDSFLTILSIGRTRLENAAASMFDGSLMVERRGGSSSKLEDVKAKVVEHISSFKCREKHYGRQTQFNRVYLPPELNVKKMHELFLQKYNVPCKYHYYYEIFRKKFNIGFGTLKTDTCSTCESYKIKMKEPTDEDSRKMLIVEQMLHVSRARRFFQLLNKVEDEQTITINFDLMSVLPLPRTQIGEAYYARQISFYVFGVIIHNAKKALNKDTVFFYRWLETEFKRGCNETISCLLHFLEENVAPLVQSSERKCKLIRFFSDSCTGQNKNYPFLLCLQDFCKKYKIDFVWYFPIRGHSYMPADRAFSFISRAVKKRALMISPDEYDDIIKTIGNLTIVGEDFSVRDHKRSAETLLKNDKGFKITEAKVLLYDHGKDQLSYQTTYSGSAERCDILKKSKQNAKLPKAPVIRRCNHASAAKLADVKKILGNLGLEFDKIEFYRNIKVSVLDNDDDENDCFTNDDLY